MYIVWLKFGVCAGIIFFAGKNIAKYADLIALKSGISRLWIGVILVAAATSLPELFTGITSAGLMQAPNLAVGNVLGANSYNLLNIAILDLINPGAPILSVVSSGQLLTAALTLIPIILVTMAIFLSENGVSIWNVGNVSLLTIAIFIFYCVSTRVIYIFEKRKSSPKDVTDPEGLKRAWISFFMAAALIIVSGIWLAYIGKEMANTLNLNESFVGSLFLGLATTLPEITVSIAAIMIGAREIAVANMLGSNLFNTAILFIDDTVYRSGPILENVNPVNIYQAQTVMAMTVVIILAIAVKSKKRFFKVSWYIPILFIIFLMGAFFNFYMRVK